MRNTWLRALCILTVLLTASAVSAGVCDDAPSLVTAALIGGDDSGIGGTGLGGDDSGIGGTGLGEDDPGIGGTGPGGGGDDSGVGGTGIGGAISVARTGIYGTITSFGSICVNGKRIHVDPEPGSGRSVEFVRNGRAASARELAVGRVVWIDARRRKGSAEFDAHRVHVVSALVGRVEAVAPRKRWLRVDGVWIDVPREALVDGASGPLTVRRGETVDVSGLPAHGGRIAASRVDRVAPWTPRWRAPALATLLRASPRARHLSIEGLVSSVGGERFAVPGLEVAAPAMRFDLQRGQRVWVEGARLAPNRLLLERARVLRRPSQGGLPPLLSPDLERRMLERRSGPPAGPPVHLDDDLLSAPDEPKDGSDLRSATPDLLRDPLGSLQTDPIVPKTPALPGLDISRPEPAAAR
jgi:hypothetical protein